MVAPYRCPHASRVSPRVAQAPSRGMVARFIRQTGPVWIRRVPVTADTRVTQPLHLDVATSRISIGGTEGILFRRKHATSEDIVPVFEKSRERYTRNHRQWHCACQSRYHRQELQDTRGGAVVKSVTSVMASIAIHPGSDYRVEC